jgi:biopolymer transport protein ExbB
MSRERRVWLLALSMALLVAPGPADVAGADALDDAYAREIELLRAEREALEEELSRVRSQGDSRTAALSDTLDALTDELARLRGVASDLEREIRAVDARRSAASAQSELLVSTAEHAREVLREHAITPDPGDSSVAATLDTLFTAGIDLVETLGGVRAEDDTFFDASGTEISGTIVHLGAIAALGVAADDGGLLAPVADTWRIAEPDGGAAARAIVAGGRAEGRVPMLLTDPNEPERMGAGRRSLVERIREGGPIVWPILALALVAIAIVLERALTLRRIERGAGHVGESVGRAVRDRDFATAERICAEHPGAVARVLESALARRDEGRERLDDAIDEAIMNEMSRLERFLPTLRVIAAVTPLLGLLGTVTGMISTFDVITEFGTGDPRLLSGGISEALVTTELGLAVAIPALLLHSMLSGRVDRIVDQMETRGLELTLTLHERDGA